MAYLVSKKGNGKIYFYIAQYVGKQPYYTSQYRYIYTIGNQQTAFERLTLWLLDNKHIPEEIIKFGISIDDLKYWHEKIEQARSQCS